jgi:hypothetical protein
MLEREWDAVGKISSSVTGPTISRRRGRTRGRGGGGCRPPASQIPKNEIYKIQIL